MRPNDRPWARSRDSEATTSEGGSILHPTPTSSRLGRQPRCTNSARTWSSATVLGLISATLMLAGCATPSDPTTPAPPSGSNSQPGGAQATDLTSAEAQLRRRPSYEQASAQYLALLTELRVALSQVTPSLTWMTPAPEPGGNALCDAPFTKVADTQRSVFNSGDAKGGIPDSDWPRAVEAIERIVGPHGFTTTSLAVDRPTRHDLALRDNLGAVLHFGTEQDTYLYLSGACFIHQNPDTGATTP